MKLIIPINTRVLTFLSLLLVIIFIPLTVIITLQSQKIRQHAAGNITFASPGDNLQGKVGSLSPGDTLILHDGLYMNQTVQTDGIHGTATSPITIEAEHDGKAIVDGGGNNI